MQLRKALPQGEDEEPALSLPKGEGPYTAHIFSARFKILFLYPPCPVRRCDTQAADACLPRASFGTTAGPACVKHHKLLKCSPVNREYVLDGTKLRIDPCRLKSTMDCISPRFPADRHNQYCTASSRNTVRCVVFGRPFARWRQDRTYCYDCSP